MSIETGNNSEKNVEHRVQERVRELRGVGDALGYGIEEGIIKEVAMLNVAGIETGASCEGHLDRNPSPWIRTEAPNEPRYRWENEKEITEKILEEIGASESAILPGKLHDSNIYEKFIRIFYDRLPEGAQEIPEYKAWVAHNRKTADLLQKLLEEFYGTTIEPSQSETPMIALDKHFQGNTIWSVDRYLESDYETIRVGTFGLQEIEERLKRRRVEMNRFTEFVLEKYRQAL